jgi:acyl-CoA dehydrogenase
MGEGMSIDAAAFGLTHAPPDVAVRAVRKDPVGAQNRRARVEAVAAIAAERAVATDRDSAFPRHAIAALRAQRLLSILVPCELGGEGARLGDVVDICYRLGQACSATAMIYAMHQIMVACVIRHARDGGWHERLLRRLSSEQLLLASSTTEARGGGNLRSSEAPIISEGSRIALERRATVISYGADADAVVTTARRSAAASASDQVLTVFLKEDYSLETIVGWDTLGMRGTCSVGFVLRAAGGADQILPDPYEKIHVETMVPFAHLTWAAVWTGIAAGAVERARLFLRHGARQAAGQLPPGAPRFTKACGLLAQLRGLLAASLQRYLEIADDRPALAAPGFQTMINMLKVEASELAVAVVMSALGAAGLSGYRNDSEFALGRHLRDVLSAPIMINNDRIVANIAPSLAMSAVPTSLYE